MRDRKEEKERKLLEGYITETFMLLRRSGKQLTETELKEELSYRMAQLLLKI